MVTTGAVQGAFTRPIPKTAGAQMRYLVRQAQRSTRRVAELLGISQRTVERYVKNQIKKSPAGTRRPSRTGGPRALAAADPGHGEAGRGHHRRHHDRRPRPVRLHRRPRQHRRRPRTPPHPRPAPGHAARLFQAQEAGLTEDQLRRLAAEALAKVYFRDQGRAHGLEVELTDLVDLEFEL